MNNSSTDPSVTQSATPFPGAMTGKVRPFTDYSLRTKLIIAFLVVALVPLSLLSLVNYRTTANTATSSVGTSLKSLADSQSLAIGDFLARQADKMQGLGLNQVLRNGVETVNAGYTGDSAQIQAQVQQQDQQWQSANEADPLIQSRLNNDMVDELQRYRDTFSDNLEVVVTDKYGAVAAATNRPQHYYQGNQDWWKAAYKNGQGSIYIDIGFATFDQSKAVYGVVIAVPMYSDNQVVGVIRTTYRVKGLTDLLAAGQLGETGRTELILPGGRMVSAMGLEPTPISSALMTQLKVAEADQYTPLTYQGIPSLVSQARVTEISELAQVTGEKTISNLGWTVVVHQDQKEGLEPVRRQTLLTLLLALATAAVVASAAVLMARFLAHPITRLTAIAQRVAAGDMTALARWEARDEIGTLSNAFNSMTQQLGSLISRLEARSRALETSAQVSRRLSTILDQKQLVAEVVDQVQRAFDYYHAHIYLANEAGQALTMASGTGEAGRAMLAGGHKIPWGKGLVGRAAESQQTVLVPDVSQADGWLPNPLLPETRAEVAVPIMAGDRVLGVLDVQHDVAGGLDEGDADLLESIAGQVAVALQNTRLFAETRQRAEYEARLNLINQTIRRAANMDSLLQVTARELGGALGAQRVAVELAPSADGDRLGQS